MSAREFLQFRKKGFGYLYFLFNEQMHVQSDIKNQKIPNELKAT